MLKILPYSDKYADEYTLVSIWQALKEDALIEDVFHGEIKTLNEFIRFTADSLMYIGLNDDNFMGAAWLYDIKGKRADIGFFFRKKYWKDPALIREAVSMFLDYCFNKLKLELLIGYLSSLNILNFAESAGFKRVGMIPQYFGNSDDAFIVQLNVLEFGKRVH